MPFLQMLIQMTWIFGIVCCAAAIARLNQPAIMIFMMGGKLCGPLLPPIEWLAIGIAMTIVGRRLERALRPFGP